MTRLDALRALERKVAAGATGRELDRALIWAAFGRDLRPLGEPIGRIIDYILDPDDMRALGAAKALHEAVLHERTFVEFHWSKRYDDESRVTINLGSNGWHAGSSTPARAWLLAIIRALIAEGEG